MDSDGVPPLDLTIKERIDIQQDIINGGDKIIYKNKRRQQTMTAWQQRWINTVKGRSTKDYCEEVKVHLESEWVLDHYVTQNLTGHGNFGARLFGFGLVDDPNRTHCKV